MLPVTTVATETPRVRAAGAGDQAAVETLLTAQSLPTAGVPEMFAADPTQFLVAVRGDDVIAVAGVEECGEHALLRSVAVCTDWQGRGLGHQLVERAMAHAESRGITALYLLTMTAEHYFPRFGFTRVEREAVPSTVVATVEFTSACPASAVTMRKTLSPSALPSS